jgi:hypothetical protein
MVKILLCKPNQNLAVWILTDMSTFVEHFAATVSQDFRQHPDDGVIISLAIFTQLKKNKN